MAESRKISDNPRLVINLKELFGVDEMPDDDGLKFEIGQEIIESIRENTQSGKSRRGTDFKKYSIGYIKSLDFIAFGKSEGQVNLTLTGDMLDSMEVSKIGRDTIEIGFMDTENAAKAAGHIKGSNNLPVRDFFGLPKRGNIKSYEDIKDEYEFDVRASAQDLVSEPSLIGEALMRIADLFDDEGFDFG
jgi:hypothetical protein